MSENINIIDSLRFEKGDKHSELSTQELDPEFKQFFQYLNDELLSSEANESTPQPISVYVTIKSVNFDDVKENVSVDPVEEDVSSSKLVSESEKSSPKSKQGKVNEISFSKVLSPNLREKIKSPSNYISCEKLDEV